MDNDNTVPQTYDLDDVIMTVRSENYSTNWTVRNAVEGIQIFGGIGSGKTSGSGRYFALKYLSKGFGGLVLTAKHDEKALWENYCEIAGRSQDLIVIEPGQKNYFNFLEYESLSAVDENVLTLNLVQVLKTVINANKEKSGNSGEDPFWEAAMDMVLANTIDLCQLAYGRVTIKMLYDVAQSAPKKPDAGQKSIHGNPSVPADKSTINKSNTDKANDNDVPEKKTAYQIAFELAFKRVDNIVRNWKSTLTEDVLKKITDDVAFTRLASNSVPELRRLEFVKSFFNSTFKNIADKTRTIIDFTFISFLYGLLRDPTYTLFCKYKSTVTPEDCLQGKIILINIPVKDYHKIGIDCQIMFKYIWQRAMERRRIKENGRPVFLWADEAQHFLHEHDASYQATARSSRIATVYISQNVPNYYANMGGERSTYKVKSFLGTLGTKIFHANADIETNKYASELIGRAYSADKSFSSQISSQFSTTQSIKYQLEEMFRPEEFGLLPTGGKENDYKVVGIVHTQGKEMKQGSNHKEIHFDQNFITQKP